MSTSESMVGWWITIHDGAETGCFELGIETHPKHQFDRWRRLVTLALGETLRLLGILYPSETWSGTAAGQEVPLSTGNWPRPREYSSP